MIASAIVGILALIAYPNYMAYLIRANRADAQTQLLVAAGLLERWYATHDSYAGFSLSGASAQSPANAARPVYRLALTEQTASTFNVRASPAASSINAGDGFMQINSLGDRAWDMDNSGAIDSDREHSWRKP